MAAASVAAGSAARTGVGRTAGDQDGGGIRLDTKKWAETFMMLHEGGLADRGAHFALTMSTLKRKGDEFQQQIDALRLAEESLLQAAREEVEKSRRQAEQGHRLPKDSKQARTWGLALANAIAQQAREASDGEANQDPPFAATLLAQECENQVAKTLEVHRRAQAEAEAQAVAEAQQALLMQAQAVAQAQAIAEEQAQALKQAQAQAEVVAQIQANLHAEATMAQEQQAEREAALVERNALRAQGLNSKKLPLRPSVPPCSYYQRTGECKYGRTCKWDHPEVSVNSKGYPMRPGDTPCAFYLRTGICKFSNTCKFDHPEGITPTLGAGGLGAAGLTAQLAALVQATALGASDQKDLVLAAAAGPPQQPPPPPLSPPQLQQLAEQHAASQEPLSEQQEQLLTMLLKQAQQDFGGSMAVAAGP